MKKPVIVISQQLPEIVEARFMRDYDARLNPSIKLYDKEKLLQLCKGADGIAVSIGDKIDADFIERLPESVRIISAFSAGFEHIDIKAASMRKIAVTNTPEILTNATADIAMLLLLGAARRAVEGDKMVRSGEWTCWNPTQLLGVQVTGKRLGILGMGSIGQAVAKRARAFDMTIHYHNRHRLPPELELGAVWHETAESLLYKSDFLSLHCPATPETVGFLDEKHISMLPDRAVVINTSRGTVVKDDDLIAALKSGKLAAAGLDVYDGEPNLNPEYRKLLNCFLLPHIGSASTETRNAMGFLIADNFDAFFAGNPLLTPVN